MSAYKTYVTSGPFIDPTIDAGFKILFGRESSKDVLIALLNVILKDDLDSPIKDVTFMDKEKVKQNDAERTMVFDLHCLTDNGKRLIVEFQNVEQKWFVERVLLYAERDMAEQSKSGDWDYEYMPVISIAFINFTLPGFEDQPVVDGAITDKYSGKQMTDRLRLIFLQLPEFLQATPEECNSELEKWIYTIKNMKNMETMPFVTTDPIFRRIEELARKENLSADDLREYERNEKAYRDYLNQVQFARSQGLKEGRSEEKISIAKNLLSNGVDIQLIASATGLSVADIRNLANN